jgi:hypothetical protein
LQNSIFHNKNGQKQQKNGKNQLKPVNETQNFRVDLKINEFFGFWNWFDKSVNEMTPIQKFDNNYLDWTPL